MFDFKFSWSVELETGIVMKGDRVIITGASSIGNAITDTIKLHVL